MAQQCTRNTRHGGARRFDPGSRFIEDNITPVLSHGPPSLRVFPPGLPCHSADKPSPTSRRSCQSGDQRSNRDPESRSGSPPRDHQATAGQASAAAPASRHRLDGHAGKCRLLGSCRSQGQWGPWILPRSGQPEIGKDPLNHGRVVDRGDPLHPSGAARTAQDVPVEGTAHQQSPRPVAGPGCARALRAGIRRPVPLRAAVDDDVRPPARAGASTP